MVDSLPLISGFMLGLSTGPICMATCLPIVFPFAISDDSGTNATGRWCFLAKFLAGRLAAYTTMGALTGLIADRIGFSGTNIGIYAWLALSLLLIAYGLGASIKHIGFCGLATRCAAVRSFPYILGFLTGLSVCPPFLLALSFVIERSANMLFAIVFFISFFCATTLYVLPIGFLGHLPRLTWFRILGRLSAVLSGIFFLWRGLSSLVRI
ncbi:MAG: sulfite exporter TauE/SafE family protein [Syntrophobacteraceae bacterium]